MGLGLKAEKKNKICGKKKKKEKKRKKNAI